MPTSAAPFFSRPSLRQSQIPVQHSHDWRPRGVPARRGVALQFGQQGVNAFWSQAECAANRCRLEFAKKLPGSLGVPGYAAGFALPDLHAGSSQMNQPLDELGFWARAAKSVPEAFPGFVCFPIKTLAKEIQGVEMPCWVVPRGEQHTDLRTLRPSPNTLL